MNSKPRTEHLLDSAMRGLIQDLVENDLDLLTALSKHGVSIPEISKQDEVFNYLFCEMQFGKAQLLWRWVWTYRTTGEYPSIRSLGRDNLTGVSFRRVHVDL